MGQVIWGVLAQYAGLWVAVDKEGKVVDHAEDLRELSLRRPGLTLVYAAKA